MASILLAPTVSSLLWLLPLLAVIWIVGVIVYNLFFHPLAHIPGPRLAAVTHLYSFYFNCIAPGSQLFVQIEKLHETYGPVVRISPSEVHLNDPDNYDKIYYVGSKYWKSPDFYGSFGIDSSTFATFTNEVHRVRRAAINPRFSRKVVLELEDVVQSKAQKLYREAANLFRAGKPVNLHNGFRAVSVDVITDYAFDNCYNLLDQDGFGVDYFDMVRALIGTFWVFYQFPLIRMAALKTPLWLAKRMNESLGNYLKMQDDCRNQILAVKASLDGPKEKVPTRVTIFHQLLRPDATEGHVVPSPEDLVAEAYSIVGAASETVGNALTIATYRVLSDDNIHSKLKAELKEAFPDPSVTLDFVSLEKLPYLTAVIKEGLRLSYGVTSRLPRVTPQPGAEFNGYKIPPGSIVGMSAYMMHRNEILFPIPDNFDPTRWLDPESAKKLDKYLVPFSKGSRQCVGMNLAYCELYVTLGTFFRRFEQLELYNVGPEDFTYEDYFSPFHPDSSRKLHVTLKES